jgi:release factor glutamine methyltransferase
VIAARERFIRAGIPPDQAAVDAEVLARHALAWDRATYIAHRLDAVAAAAVEQLETLVARREGREPVAYITGTREFWSRDFLVTPAVLIPRPETELIVEHALGRLAERSRAWRLADVGTGSGCLAVTLAAELPRAQVLATDVSLDALHVARDNAARHGVADRVTFAQASLLTHHPGPFDLIVANLPYVPRALTLNLMPDVARYEPVAALYGRGEDGLGEIRDLLAQAGARLAAGGVLLLEFGFGQVTAVADAVAAEPALRLDTVLMDLQGHARAVVVERSV